MKKLAGMAVLAVLSAVLVWSGGSLAAEKQEGKSPEHGTWEYQWAMETGSLPAAPGMSVWEEKSISDARTPTVEIGGRIYRIGVDTP